MNTNRPKISLTRNIPFPTYYVSALDGEFKDWAYNEERAPQFKGLWRSEVFKKDADAAIDLEIGTGNGWHFTHYAQSYSERNLVGIELKYKPLIQTIRRALKADCKNARMVRYHASHLVDIFSEHELNHVFIHFPDPWAKKESRKKHRLIQARFLEELRTLQRPGSFVELKTDNRDYFDWVVECFKGSDYKMERLSYDLHQSEYVSENYVTAFEKIFLAQGLPINYIRCQV